MTFTNDERKALYTLLADIPNPDPAQARDLAQTILLSNLDRLAEDVRRELERMEGERRRDVENAGRYYYTFLSPPSEPELINSTENTDYYAPPQRQEYRVKVRDLAAFCKQHGLREKEMVKVGLGQIEDHKGWTHRGGYGGPMELGQPYQRPRPVEAPAQRANGPKEKRTVFRFAPKPIDWFPGLDS